MALSKAKRSEIAKKAWRKRKNSTTPSKRRTTLSASPSKRKTTRRKPSRRRSGLAEIITNLEAKTGFENVARGAAGGLIGYGLEEILPATMGNRQKLFWGAVASFGLATIGKSPYMGAGLAGVIGYKALAEIGFLNENYADPLEQLPMVLDADGNPMMLNEDETGGLYLDENGDPMYLDENGDPMYLDEDGYQVAYAPDFGASFQETGW